MKTIQYVAITLGINGGLNPSSNSGLKDSIEEASAWGEAHMAKNANCPSVAIATITNVLERQAAPFVNRRLYMTAPEGMIPAKTETKSYVGPDGYTDESFLNDGTRDRV